MKDILGNKVIPGDIMLECTGWGRSTEGHEYHIDIWEVPKINDGHGIHYDIDGSKCEFWWARTQQATRVNIGLLPSGFEYSFRHGMNGFTTKLKEGSVIDIINSSDWEKKRIEEAHVAQYAQKKTLKLESLGDIMHNIDLLSSGFIPTEIVSQVLELFNLKESKAINGEIGISSGCDFWAYSCIINKLQKEKI